MGVCGRNSRANASDVPSLLQFAGDDGLALVSTFMSTQHKGGTQGTFIGIANIPAHREHFDHIPARQDHFDSFAVSPSTSNHPPRRTLTTRDQRRTGDAVSALAAGFIGVLLSSAEKVVAQSDPEAEHAGMVRRCYNPNGVK